MYSSLHLLLHKAVAKIRRTITWCAFA